MFVYRVITIATQDIYNGLRDPITKLKKLLIKKLIHTWYFGALFNRGKFPPESPLCNK